MCQPVAQTLGTRVHDSTVLCTCTTTSLDHKLHHARPFTEIKYLSQLQHWLCPFPSPTSDLDITDGREQRVLRCQHKAHRVQQAAVVPSSVADKPAAAHAGVSWIWLAVGLVILIAHLQHTTNRRHGTLWSRFNYGKESHREGRVNLHNTG